MLTHTVLRGLNSKIYPQKRAEIVEIHCQLIWYLEQNKACTTISLQLKNDIARDSRAISFLPCSEIAKSWKKTNFFHWFLMFLLGIKSKLHLGSLHRQIFCRDEAMKALTKALTKVLTKASRKTLTLELDSLKSAGSFWLTCSAVEMVAFPSTFMLAKLLSALTSRFLESVLQRQT